MPDLSKQVFTISFRSKRFVSSENSRQGCRAASIPGEPRTSTLELPNNIPGPSLHFEPGNHDHRIRAGSVEQATLGQDHQYGHTWKPGSYEMAVRSQEKPTSLFFPAIGPGTGPISVTRAFEGHLPLLLLRSRIPPSPSGRFCSGVGDGQSEPLRVDSAERLECDQKGIPD